MQNVKDWSDEKLDKEMAFAEAALDRHHKATAEWLNSLRAELARRSKKGDKRRTLDRRQARALKITARISAQVDEHARRSVDATRRINAHIADLEQRRG